MAAPRGLVLPVLGLLAACGRSSLPDVSAPRVDLGTQVDLATDDLSLTIDLDLAVSVDLARPPDLAQPPDLANGPDLALPPVIATLFAGQLGGWGGRDAAGTNARFATPMDVVSDGAGNLYVADASNHAVRKIVLATGQVSTLAGSFTDADSVDAIGTAARFWTPYNLAYDGVRGALYVADPTDETIRRIKLSDGAVTTLAGKSLTWGKQNGTGSTARFHYPKGLAFDGDKTLFIADSWNALIQKLDVTSGAVSTLAGTGFPGVADGVGTAAAFDEPVALAYDAGVLYVADSSALTIRKIIVATAEVSTFAGTAGSTGSTDGTGPAARFRTPTGITADGAGHLYVSDAGMRRVRKIDIGPVFGTVGPFAGGASVLYLDGAGAAAGFRYPMGLGVLGSTLYVADSQNSTVRAVDISAQTVTSPFGLPPHTGASDGAATAATFNSPDGLAVDETDRVYVTEVLNNDVRVIAGGVVSVLAGNPPSAGSSDGLGTAARFSSPNHITYDRAGSLFVTQGLGKIRKIATADGNVTSPYPSPTGGNGVVALAGYLYISSGTGNSIRRLDLSTGVASVFAGDPGGQYGTTDGTGTAARFTSPSALSTDGVDRIFVSDWYGQSIRQITVSDGEVTTIAGSAAQPGYVDDVGTAARFTNVQSLAWHGGALYLGEYSMHTVRKLALSTGAVSTYAGIVGTQVVQPGALGQVSLNTPSALAFLSDGTLLVASHNEQNIVAIPLH